MSGLTDAISWTGTEVMLILFVAFPSGAARPLITPPGVSKARVVKDYDLEDIDRLLGERSWREYDVVYDEVPPDLATIVESWIVAALDAGADFAWFAFEGSFSFKHIMTSDMARQVFAVGTPEGTALALDDGYRRGPEWVALLGAVRKRLGLPGE